MSLTWYLVVSALIFSIGAGGVLVRRNPLVILLCLELMLNAGNLEIDMAPVKPEQLAALIGLIEGGKISGSAGKQVLDAMFSSGKDAEAVVAELGLGRIEDNSVVEKAVADVIAANPKAVEDYRAGKTEAVKFLVGQVMRETRGRANAADVQEMLVTKLDGAGSP